MVHQSSAHADEDLPKYGPIDLRDQNAVFLVLEELGVAHLQRDYVLNKDPSHSDVPALQAQADEFFEDLTAILAGEAKTDRIIQNGWAGAALVAHLRRALADELAAVWHRFGGEGEVDRISDSTVVALALRIYLEMLSKLSADVEARTARGEKPSPKIYIDLMAGWSALVCGAADRLQVPAECRVD